MKLVGYILRHKFVAICLFILAVLVLNYLFVTVPNAQAAEYKARMSPGIASVKQLFKQVSDSTDSALFNDPDVPFEEKQQLLANTAKLNSQAQLALEHLKEDASQLGRPVIAPTGDYNDAARLREKLLPVIAQSQDAIAEYSLMVGFLQKYYNIQSKIEPVVGANNLVSANARLQLQNEADQLLSTNVPADLKEVQAKTAALLGEIGGADSQATIDKKDELNSELFVLISGESVTVDNIRELSEKLESNNL